MNLPKTDDNDRSDKNNENTNTLYHMQMMQISWYMVKASFWTNAS